MKSIGLEEDPKNLFIRTYKVPYEHANGVGAFEETGPKTRLSCFVTWAAVPGLTLEQIHKYRRNVTNGKAFDVHINVSRQEPIEGFPLIFTRVTMPHMYSHRLILTAHYTSDSNEPFETMSSSWGNDKHPILQKPEYKEDVTAFMHLNYIRA